MNYYSSCTIKLHLKTLIILKVVSFTFRRSLIISQIQQQSNLIVKGNHLLFILIHPSATIHSYCLLHSP